MYEMEAINKATNKIECHQIECHIKGSTNDVSNTYTKTYTVDFNNWTLFEPKNQYKVMHHDQIEITYLDNKISSVKIINSKRDKLILSGVLELDTKMIYGYNKQQKPYKIFTPFNKNFPKFLVAYENSRSKKSSDLNKIISIKFNSWIIEYPIGQNVETFCDLDPRFINDNMIQSYSRSLLFYNGFYQIKRLSNTYDKSKLIEAYGLSLTNLSYHTLPKYDFKLICNIDPPGCIDIDDVISYTELDDRKIIGVHITDVVYVLKIFNQVYPDLLKQTYKTMFESELYATVYPHGIKPYGIIPDIFVENFLTLNPMQKRYVWSIYLHINDLNQIIDVELKPELIENQQTFTYDEAENILKEPTKNELVSSCLKSIIQFCESYGKLTFPSIYETYDNHQTNSHYLITILMTFANQYVGNYLSTDLSSIYRTTIETKFDDDSIHMSSYTINRPDNNIHHVMNLHNYTHYTSPIRRFIDQYTHIRLYKKMFDVDMIGLTLNEKAMITINRSLLEMKLMGNQNKVLSLIDTSKTDNYHQGKLIAIKYNPITKKLYLKWVINDSIRISDTINNPLIMITTDETIKTYTMINRLNSTERDDCDSNKIIFKLGNKYSLNIKFMLLNALKTPKVSIEYFSL
jgi:hypothetical protein